MYRPICWTSGRLDQAAFFSKHLLLVRRWLSGLVVGRASYGGVSLAAGAASATGKTLTCSAVHGAARAVQRR